MIETINYSGPLTIIAICTALGLTVILWVIIGMPWPARKKKPTMPKIVDWQLSEGVGKMAKAAQSTGNALADLGKAFGKITLDEHETKIS